ncbi:discoidin domain-containing receptor tyrosine kinase B-like [Schistocerca americana]|uniref:discoidin domain-containing receptor tyrosine kinase B-like n=1 Tax=Schistocerca americana TaxID=7009 RepID=UPI001F4F6043|nr:discoidin domain-containing receptor tyrosine kinase B-like [Schistocerca americana]
MQFLAAVALLSLHVALCSSLDVSQCVWPLGMESGAIPDKDITASSSFDSGNVGPHVARVRTDRNGGAWCPKRQVTSEPVEWLQVELRDVHLVTAVETQGRFGNGQGREFAENFLLEYWRPALNKWVRYRPSSGKEVLPGNTNTYTESRVDLEPAVFASRVRFLPFSHYPRTACMRVELYGCRYTDGVLRYSMPQGDSEGPGGRELLDAWYDGRWEGQGRLHGGLGLLTDGSVRADLESLATGYGWVGWRNETRAGQPVEIIFEFDKVREFTGVHIFTDNEFTRSAEVFAEARLFFSVTGREFPGEPISFVYVADHIFETPRNVSIKLHHRIGRFVKLLLFHASEWIRISEVTFDSDVAHGNFTDDDLGTSLVHPVLAGSTEKPKTKPSSSELPVTTAREEPTSYLAAVVGVLSAVALLLAALVYVAVARHRRRKAFPSPLPIKVSAAAGAGAGSAADEAAAFRGDAVRDCEALRGTLDPLLRPAHRDFQDYQEPFYSYSSVIDKCLATQSETSHEYAVPEQGGLSLPPFLATPPPARSDRHTPAASSTSRSTTSTATKSDSSTSNKSSNLQEALAALKMRLQQATLPEFPRHRLRMISRISDGAFGTVYVAEADGIMEFGGAPTLGKRLVAVKSLPIGAAEKSRLDFMRDARILSALDEPHLSRVLGVCTLEEPMGVVLEYLDHGDLNLFLRQHHHEDDPYITGANTVSSTCLLYIASQIASGMRYLETLNFVHRDLATRNCIVGKAYHVKICDFGTNNELYAADYYPIDGSRSLPVRWMAPESVCQGKYTTKSDVWSFAVTLWEVLTLCRRRPYESLSDQQVLEALQHCYGLERTHCLEDAGLELLPCAPCGPRDVQELMAECWRPCDADRPTFREIQLFLQRKTLGYAPLGATV